MGRFFNTTGKRIRILREDKGLNQKELSSILTKRGVRAGLAMLSRLETDSVGISTDILKALADVLDTTTDYLLLRSESAKARVEPNYFSEEADEAGKVFDSLPQDERQKMLEVVKAYDADYRDFLRHKRKRDQMRESIIARGGEEAWQIVEEYIKTVGLALLANRNVPRNQFRDFLDDSAE